MPLGPGFDLRPRSASSERSPYSPHKLLLLQFIPSLPQTGAGRDLAHQRGGESRQDGLRCLDFLLRLAWRGRDFRASWRPSAAAFTCLASSLPSPWMTNSMVDPDRLSAAFETARCDLLAESSPVGHWTGQLSSSPLSTAAAIAALALVERHAPTIAGRVADENRECQLSKLIIVSLRWLARHQNADGGWGDSDKSPSNIAATMMVRAAFALTCVPAESPGILERADAYISAFGGVRGLRRRYGDDRPLTAGILAASALGGLVSWRQVPALPFERTACPERFWSLLRLPIGSQGVAVLVALGQARYVHRKPRNLLVRLARRLTIDGSLRTLCGMQPAGSGFEHSPLSTSFVIIGLAGSGRSDHPVVRAGVDFLFRCVRAGGSWPIESDVSVLNTSQSARVLADVGEDMSEIGGLNWLLSCQQLDPHASDAEKVGGWAHTDLQGATPRVDASAEALLAMSAWRKAGSASRVEIDAAAIAGIRWLLARQGPDGGSPPTNHSFSQMPAAAGACDSTALALRALVAWRGALSKDPEAPNVARDFLAKTASAIERGFRFMKIRQAPHGCWEASAHGSQSVATQNNLVIGTALALLAFRDADRLDCESVRRGLAWLEASMHADGSFGGELLCERRAVGGVHCVEETALAVEALLTCGPESNRGGAAFRGLNWLIDAVESNRHQSAAPIGLAFGKLSYYEKLLPLALAVSALGQAMPRLRPRTTPRSAAHAAKT
jgi:squalene-hopene/tetraprenyl-beta-curcumene cyclase